MFTSLKARIVLFYLFIIFTTLSVMSIFLYLSLSKIVYSSLDSSLLARAKVLATLISENDQETEFTFSDDVMWEYSSPNAKSFFQIRLPAGSTLEKSASLKKRELPYKAATATNFKTITLDDEPVRLVNFYLGRENEGKNKTGGRPLIIQCAEEIEDRVFLLNAFGVVLAGTVLFIMIISAAGGFLIAKRALKPIKDISETIDKISETNLSARIAENAIADELKGIASSFNRAFGSLEKAFNRQRQFTADASHELKTPLSVIITQGEVALRREREPGEYRVALVAIMEAARMMSLLIEKLLTLARLSHDKLALQAKDAPLSGIIQRAVRLLAPLAEKKGIVISMEGKNQYSVYGDEKALLEVFVNILDNAVKYNAINGKIDITMAKSGEFIIVQITDTGIGISEEELETVFDRFYRVDKSRSRESGGNGLGLSICREILMLHGGEIWLKSRSGAGTTAFVSLKASQNT